VIRNVAVEPETAEPAVGQIEVDPVAQAALGANAETVADDQHAHHQLGIDRRPPRLAVVGAQIRPQLAQIHKAVDLAKQVVVGDMPLEAEAVEQRLQHYPPLAHHGVSPRFALESAWRYAQSPARGVD
jgi:hypothetical protein